jgi:hypothetical protein
MSPVCLQRITGGNQWVPFTCQSDSGSTPQDVRPDRLTDRRSGDCDGVMGWLLRVFHGFVPPVTMIVEA